MSSDPRTNAASMQNKLPRLMRSNARRGSSFVRAVSEDAAAEDYYSWIRRGSSLAVDEYRDRNSSRGTIDESAPCSRRGSSLLRNVSEDTTDDNNFWLRRPSNNLVPNNIAKENIRRGSSFIRTADDSEQPKGTCLLRMIPTNTDAAKNDDDATICESIVDERNKHLEKRRGSSFLRMISAEIDNDELYSTGRLSKSNDVEKLTTTINNTVDDDKKETEEKNSLMNFIQMIAKQNKEEPQEKKLWKKLFNKAKDKESADAERLLNISKEEEEEEKAAEDKLMLNLIQMMAIDSNKEQLNTNKTMNLIRLLSTDNKNESRLLKIVKSCENKEAEDDDQVSRRSSKSSRRGSSFIRTISELEEHDEGEVEKMENKSSLANKHSLESISEINYLNISDSSGEWNNFWTNYSSTYGSKYEFIDDLLSTDSESVTETNCIYLTFEEATEALNCSRKITEILLKAVKRSEQTSDSDTEQQQQTGKQQQQLEKQQGKIVNNSCIDAFLTHTGVADILKRVISKKKEVILPSN